MLLVYMAYIYDHKYDPVFERIISKYQAHMMQIVWDILNHREDCEDALQNAFFAIARNIEKLAGMDEPAVKVYVCKCARSAALNMRLDQQKRENIVPLEDYMGVSDENIQKEYISRENYEQILQILRSLPDIYYDVLSMTYIYGMKPREIAISLGRPIETVKSRLQRGKAYLRQYLKEEIK